MAPTLTSNSFLLSTAPGHARLALRNHPKFTPPVSAKLNFRLGNKAEEAQDTGPEDPNKASPGFFFDIKSLVPVVAQPSTAISFGNARRKDSRTVFVAGATGQSGIRIAQTLLRQGFAVRAGVPNLGSAQDLARLAAKYKMISSEESRRLNAVEIGLQDPEAMAKAIGNASKVVVTIGPFEDGASSAVTTSDAVQVIQAAQLASVSHVAVIYESSSVSVTSTYNVLDGITSFFSNLFSSSQPLSLTEFLQKVVETDVSYTLIKASLTEDYSSDYSANVVVKPEGSTTTASGKELKVSRSQIASVVAEVFSNTSVAENKVVEVCTNPSAPSKPIDQLFGAIPEDGRRKAYAEALAKAKAEEEALLASEKARKAAEAAKKLEEEVKKLSDEEASAASLAKEAQEKAKAAGTSLEGLMSKAKDISGGFSWDKLSSQITTAVTAKGNGPPTVQIATIRGEIKARSLAPQKTISKQPVSKPKSKPQPKSPETKTEVKNVFGGLFKQETIYVDDD